MHNEGWITIWHSNNETYMEKMKCSYRSSLPPPMTIDPCYTITPHKSHI